MSAPTAPGPMSLRDRLAARLAGKQVPVVSPDFMDWLAGRITVHPGALAAMLEPIVRAEARELARQDAQIRYRIRRTNDPGEWTVFDHRWLPIYHGDTRWEALAWLHAQWIRRGAHTCRACLHGTPCFGCRLRGDR